MLFAHRTARQIALPRVAITMRWQEREEGDRLRARVNAALGAAAGVDAQGLPLWEMAENADGKVCLPTLSSLTYPSSSVGAAARRGEE